MKLAVLLTGILLTGWSCVTTPAVQPTVTPRPVVVAETDAVAVADRSSVVYVEQLAETQFAITELMIASAERQPLFTVAAKPIELLVSPDQSYILERDVEALRLYQFSDHSVTRLHEAGVASVHIDPSGFTIQYTLQDGRTLMRDVSITGNISEPYVGI